MVLGAFAGALGDAVQDVFHFVLIKLGLLRYSLDDYAGSVFFRGKSFAVLSTPLGHFTGFLSGMAFSVILGVIFIYLVFWTGYRFVKIKGILYGFVLWFLVYGGVKTTLHISLIQDYHPAHTVEELFLHLLFGLVLGIVAEFFGGQALRKEP